MDNRTEDGNMLQIEDFALAPQYIYPVFFILLFTYLIIMITNTGVMVLIATERSLQQPMYLLFCNLSFNDIMGNTNILPKIMSHLLLSERYITYAECVIQAFCSHIYGTAAHTILMVMAFDRCRSVIVNAYCDNASLFKLSCEDVSINNIYGLIFTALLFGSSMGSIAITYFRIVTVCLTKKSKELNSKALQTCASHVALYMIMLWTGFSTIITHRFQMSSVFRKLASVLFHVVPAYLNPIIYAVHTKELKSKIIQLFCSVCK
uniref:G-protein coupled receptors family 1 profile domain-containing protein n=1 Tax=Scleropages formosus TaxID=113540 RepID=A0A8C9SNS2_SCLFO